MVNTIVVHDQQALLRRRRLQRWNDLRRRSIVVALNDFNRRRSPQPFRHFVRPLFAPAECRHVQANGFGRQALVQKALDRRLDSSDPAWQRGHRDDDVGAWSHRRGIGQRAEFRLAQLTLIQWIEDRMLAGEMAVGLNPADGRCRGQRRVERQNRRMHAREDII